MRTTTWISIAILICVHLIVDLIVPNLFYGPDSEWILAPMMGLCIGQINLIGVWAAMAPGRVVLRLPWSIFLATMMWYALVIGNRLRHFWVREDYYFGNFRSEDALQLGLILLAAVILVQIPLWAASRLLRWRLTPPGRNDSDQKVLDERQFNIKHLIISMVIVGVALGLGRLVLPPADGQLEVARLDRELTVLLPVIAGVNLVVALPCIWGAFVPWRWIAPLVVGWIVYAVFVTVIEIVVLTALLGPGPPPNIYPLMSLFNICQCLAVFGTLLCLRGIGFRLVRVNTLPKPTCEMFGDVR